MLLKPIKAFLVFFFFFLSFLSLQLGFDLDREVYPLVVHAVVDEGDGRGALCHPPHTLPSGGTRPATFPAGVGQQALTAPPTGTRAHAHLPQLRGPTRTPLGSRTGPLVTAQTACPMAGLRGRSAGVTVHCAHFFSRAPFFLSEYFGHCHVLLGTFEKVRASLRCVYLCCRLPCAPCLPAA